MKVYQIVEAKSAAVIAFGRMNPPTIGHKKLVDKIKSLPGDPYIFLSQSQKPKTDPLDFQTKLRYAKFFFPELTIGNPEVKTIIQALQKINQLGYTELIYVAGSDRVESFQELINKYNGVEYNFNNIQVVSAGERDPDADGAEGMSASKMRAAAASGDFDSFAQGVPNQELAHEMFAAVRKGMGIKDKEGVTEQTPPINVPQGWEAKTQPDGSTRISKKGSMSSAEYKQNMADYKAKNWTPDKRAEYARKMAPGGGGYTDAEKAANYQDQQKYFGNRAAKPSDDLDEQSVEKTSDPNKLMAAMLIDGEYKEFDLTPTIEKNNWIGTPMQVINQAEKWLSDFLRKRGTAYSNLTLSYKGASVKSKQTGDVDAPTDLDDFANQAKQRLRK